jgi:DNA-binding response OmpR family regulator
MGNTPESGKKRVLVAEDEPNIQKLVRLQLERAGCEVLIANDGQEALEIVRTQRLDLAIIDVMMPYVDGLSVVREIRSSPERDHLPVVLLTVKAQEKEVWEGYDAGADLYLTKPFEPGDVARLLDLTR